MGEVVGVFLVVVAQRVNGLSVFHGGGGTGLGDTLAFIGKVPGDLADTATHWVLFSNVPCNTDLEMQVLSNTLDYTRKPGFVAADARNDRCIVIVQVQNDFAAASEVQFYMPRTYKHVKRVTLKRVDVPSSVTVAERIMHFTKYDGSDLFPTVQRATTSNVTYKGFLVDAGEKNLDLVLANYRDSEGTFDQVMGLKQSAWVDTVTDYRVVLTFELELALWQ